MKPGPGSQPRSRSAVKRDRRGYSRARFTHHHRPVQWWWRWWVVVCWWWWWWWWCGWYGLSTGGTVPGGTTGQAGRQLRLPHCLATTDCLYWLESTAWLCGDRSHYQRRPAPPHSGPPAQGSPPPHSPVIDLINPKPVFTDHFPLGKTSLLLELQLCSFYRSHLSIILTPGMSEKAISICHYFELLESGLVWFGHIVRLFLPAMDILLSFCIFTKYILWFTD